MATFTLVKRSAFGWGASGADYAHPTKGLVVHYDGSDQGLAKKSHSSCVTYWKNTRKFHMGSERGWADIGYSFGVCPHGYVFEGRGLNKAQAAQPGGNTTWYSCTFMSGDHESPTDAQVQAFLRLRAWLRSKGVGAAVSYHGKFISTSCPGSKLRTLVTSGKLSRNPNGAGGAPASPAKPPAFTKTLRQPPVEQSSQCRAWQQRMRDRGWMIEVDGWYGGDSEAVCRAFQKEKNLTVSGNVDEKTWFATWTAKVT